jgi:uncharacterized protein YjiS (DUF1127 family)
MINKNNDRTAHVGDLNALQIEAQLLRAEAMVDTMHSVGRGIRSLFRALVQMGKRTAVSLERKRMVDRIFGELSRMTDRDLADIGLCRGDILAVSDGTYRRDPVSVVKLRPVAKADTAEAELPRAA